MDSLTFFVASMVSLALIHSMVYNSRRLETVGYTLSVAFLQHVIAGNEDIFLICPQFPVYVSPKDKKPSPDETLPDPEAKGVYVDHALLLPRASQTQGNLKLSQAFSQALKQRNHNFWRSVHIHSLEVALLEEKKRAPTRHPHDLDDYVSSILGALDAAQSQVTTQAKILFSSPRFSTQTLVILVASSGQYYRLATLSRGHHALSTVPSNFDVMDLLAPPREVIPDTDAAAISADIRDKLTVSARSPAEQEKHRLKALRDAQIAEKKKHDSARNARAKAREQRQEELSDKRGHERELSQLVIDAGDPQLDIDANDPQQDFYSDKWIEAYYKIHLQTLGERSGRWYRFGRYPTFFEPEPKRLETMTTFGNLKDPSDNRAIIFTGVIRLGSPVSEKFLDLIRQHLSNLARLERSERQSKS